MDKFVSIKRSDALQLLDDDDYDTEVRRVGRHWYVKTDAPLPRMHRAFYDVKGRLVDNGPDAEYFVEMDYIGDQLVSAEIHFLD